MQIKNTTSAIFAVWMYYNIYLIKKVYFGYEIFLINKSQENILRKIYELVLLKKIGLSVKFPRDILCTINLY